MSSSIHASRPPRAEDARYHEAAQHVFDLLNNESMRILFRCSENAAEIQSLIDNAHYACARLQASLNTSIKISLVALIPVSDELLPDIAHPGKLGMSTAVPVYSPSLRNLFMQDTEKSRDCATLLADALTIAAQKFPSTVLTMKIAAERARRPFQIPSWIPSNAVDHQDAATNSSVRIHPEIFNFLSTQSRVPRDSLAACYGKFIDDLWRLCHSAKKVTHQVQYNKITPPWLKNGTRFLDGFSGHVLCISRISKMPRRGEAKQSAISKQVCAILAAFVSKEIGLRQLVVEALQIRKILFPESVVDADFTSQTLSLIDARVHSSRTANNDTRFTSRIEQNAINLLGEINHDDKLDSSSKLGSEIHRCTNSCDNMIVLQADSPKPVCFTRIRKPVVDDTIEILQTLGPELEHRKSFSRFKHNRTESYENTSQIVTQINDIIVRQSTINRITSGGYLNDIAINAFLQILSSNEVYVVDCSVYSILIQYGPERIHRWFYRAPGDPLSHSRFIVFPLHNAAKKHWAVVVMDVKKKSISLLDSLVSINAFSNAAEALERWATLAKQDMSLSDSWPKHWFISKNLPPTQQQSNGTDCGIFTCLHAYITTYHSEAKSLPVRSSGEWRTTICDALKKNSVACLNTILQSYTQS